MSDDLVRLHFQVIRQRLAALKQNNVEAWGEIDAVLEDLHVIYEQMQTSLTAAEETVEELRQHNQQLAEYCYSYSNLFQALPFAYLVIDSRGTILEANQATAQLLNVPQPYLLGKPLSLYVAVDDHLTFSNQLKRLSQKSGIQVWQITVKPQKSNPVLTEWHVAIARNPYGLIESLQVGIYLVQPAQGAIAQGSPGNPYIRFQQETQQPLASFPQSLDGLQVLVVDDDSDICEFITALLESYGIKVRTVNSTAEALEVLQQFHPDVLLSDIRMPDGDGYSLIRQIRSLESGQRAHIPAAAITAYIEEDQEKALRAGFEAYLHKLAQPIEWVETVAQLARQGNR